MPFPLLSTFLCAVERQLLAMLFVRHSNVSLHTDIYECDSLLLSLYFHTRVC
uniref:Uncharacterized protein n=1 Tax=Anguilla anguilla TaxID=7936 RepID=A0A0E9WYL4_ANGAN